MASVTYKCLSCGGYLTFDPDKQKWSCPFCNSVYDEKELLGKAEERQQEAEKQAESGGGQVVYHCQSCGSEIMTDETTVATQCYYCHSPVVLQGKLTADMKPDQVLPFTISKEKAVEAFMKWVGKKRFVPKGFFSQDEVRSMSGVYYPHFVSDCVMDGRFEGEGTNTSVADTGKYVVTSTQHFHVMRQGTITLRNIMRPALSKQNRKLADGIHPFPLDTLKPFSGAYLSGFLAERRDVDQESLKGDLAEEIEGYAEPLLTGDMPYANFHGNTQAKLQKLNSQYVMLPTWVLTYPNKSDPKDPYFYAMNGCTGKVCGKLPLNMGKLWGAGLLFGAALFALGCVLSYFFF